MSDSDLGQHTYETLTQPLRASNGKQDSIQRDSHQTQQVGLHNICGRKADEEKQCIRDKKGHAEIAKQRVSVQKRHRIRLPQLRKQSAHRNKQYRSSSKGDQDLCIDVDGLVNIVPQLEDNSALLSENRSVGPVAAAAAAATTTTTTTTTTAKPHKCYICVAKFEDQEQLNSHLEEDHPGTCTVGTRAQDSS